MSNMPLQNTSTQRSLLLSSLLTFYKDERHLERMLAIINGDSKTSLRIVDWFATNYAKKYWTVYTLPKSGRFKVYTDYKLKLRSYSKRRFDPFCRWERISVPYKDGTAIQTTLGQLNFFKWAIENGVIDYIDANHAAIEADMNKRNSSSRRVRGTGGRTRKRREELSVSAVKSVKQEDVEITISFD